MMLETAAYFDLFSSSFVGFVVRLLSLLLRGLISRLHAVNGVCYLFNSFILDEQTGHQCLSKNNRPFIEYLRIHGSLTHNAII